MNMVATAKIHDLTALTATPWENVEQGSLYLRDGVLEIATIANGRPFFMQAHRSGGVSPRRAPLQN